VVALRSPNEAVHGIADPIAPVKRLSKIECCVMKCPLSGKSTKIRGRLDACAPDGVDGSKYATRIDPAVLGAAFLIHLLKIDAGKNSNGFVLSARQRP
jgi:hypothetical protein